MAQGGKISPVTIGSNITMLLVIGFVLVLVYVFLGSRGVQFPWYANTSRPSIAPSSNNR